MRDDHYTPKPDDNARLPAISEPADARAQRHIPVLLRLIRRAVLFLGLETLALALYYVSGNLQHFLEIDIMTILRVTGISAIALALFCAAGMAASIWFAVAQKRPAFLLRLIPYGILLVLAAALTVFVLTVDLLSAGLA
ncbi:MAG: hypothetical protein K2J14_00335 [Treponemataceae bacterium]|nr:hypothetical protein [Treponemataceae bacterium]